MRAVVLSIVLVLSGCGAGAKLSGFGGSSSSSAPSDTLVQLPNVFGMTLADAKAAFERAGVRGEVQDGNNGCLSVVDGKIIDVGHVCYQSPGAGQTQRASLMVVVQVQKEDPRHGGSGDTEWRLMPDVTGMTIDEARAALAAAGFPDADKIEGTPISEAGCTAGHVCHTYPGKLERSGLTSGRAIFVGQ